LAPRPTLRSACIPGATIIRSISAPPTATPPVGTSRAYLGSVVHGFSQTPGLARFSGSPVRINA
jgi:hypothetical protein